MENIPPMVEVQTCAATLEINVVVSQKIGSQSTSRPTQALAIIFLDLCPKDTLSNISIHQSHFRDQRDASVIKSASSSSRNQIWFSVHMSGV